jgi:hypothetical protein
MLENWLSQNEREKPMPLGEEIVISYKEWEEKYIPIHADIIDFLDDAIELAGDSPDAIKYIWTAVDNNPNSIYLDVLPGIRVFNRLGFHVTSKPWTDIDTVVSNDPSYR